MLLLLESLLMLLLLESLLLLLLLEPLLMLLEPLLMLLLLEPGVPLLVGEPLLVGLPPLHSSSLSESTQEPIEPGLQLCPSGQSYEAAAALLARIAPGTHSYQSRRRRRCPLG